MKIVFTKHANGKFKVLKDVGVIVSKNKVIGVLKRPEKLDLVTDIPNIIASGKLDKDHVLRVVYRSESDIMIIITFYPARRERYN